MPCVEVEDKGHEHRSEHGDHRSRGPELGEVERDRGAGVVQAPAHDAEVAADGRKTGRDLVAPVAQGLHELVRDHEGIEEREHLEGPAHDHREVGQGWQPGPDGVVEEDQAAGKNEGQALHHPAREPRQPGVVHEPLRRGCQGGLYPPHEAADPLLGLLRHAKPPVWNLPTGRRPGRHHSSRSRAGTTRRSPWACARRCHGPGRRHPRG